MDKDTDLSVKQRASELGSIKEQHFEHHHRSYEAIL